jgi:hypothetical protein
MVIAPKKCNVRTLIRIWHNCDIVDCKILKICKNDYTMISIPAIFSSLTCRTNGFSNINAGLLSLNEINWCSTYCQSIVRPTGFGEEILCDNLAILRSNTVYVAYIPSKYL